VTDLEGHTVEQMLFSFQGMRDQTVQATSACGFETSLAISARNCGGVMPLVRITSASS
jgi:hypothetical protein